jgi:hypothetical protein
MPFYSQHLPSGQEGGAVAVNVRARLPSPVPSQLSDSSSRRKPHRAGAPSLFTISPLRFRSATRIAACRSRACLRVA